MEDFEVKPEVTEAKPVKVKKAEVKEEIKEEVKVTATPEKKVKEVKNHKTSKSVIKYLK